MKTVLIFIDWFTPGYKAGGPVSSNANMIAHLQGEYHFKVVTRNTEYMETTPYKGIVPDTWVPMEGFEGYYISRQKLAVGAIRRMIRDTEADVVYVNGIYSLYFSILPLFFAKVFKKRVIVSARGMLSPHSFAVKGIKKNFFMQLSRITGLYRNITFHATNEEEAGYIRAIVPAGSSIVVAPNLPKALPGEVVPKIKNPGELRLIYIGRVAPEKNTLFAMKMLQRLSQGQAMARCNIVLDIYGSVYNPEYWDTCQRVMAELPGNIRVVYHGSVAPEKIGEVLQSAHFLFQPSLGENYGHTIAESLQHAVPVIISDKTPWRGLEEVGSMKDEVRSPDSYREKEEVRGKTMTWESRQTSDHEPQPMQGEESPQTSDHGRRAIQGKEIPHTGLQSAIRGVGWDISLEDPERFVKVIEYCAAMGQEEYDAMSQRAFVYAKKVTEDEVVVEASRKMFG